LTNASKVACLLSVGGKEGGEGKKKDHLFTQEAFGKQLVLAKHQADHYIKKEIHIPVMSDSEAVRGRSSSFADEAEPLMEWRRRHTIRIRLLVTAEIPETKWK